MNGVTTLYLELDGIEWAPRRPAFMPAWRPRAGLVTIWRCSFTGGIAVSIVNPLQIKVFGQSELVRTKTDKVDAGVIARFCRSQSPALWQPPSAHVRELRALVRRCAALKEMRVQDLQRQAQGTSSDLVKASLERMLAWLNGEIKTVRDYQEFRARLGGLKSGVHRLCEPVAEQDGITSLGVV